MQKAPRTKIICKGTIPGTNRRCGADLLETDGVNFFIKTGDGLELLLELNPPKVKCNICGYKTILGASKNVSTKALQFTRR
jgi:hypothetical protein